MPRITAAQRREAPRLVPRGSRCPRPACAPRCRRLALALALGRRGGQGTRCARPVLGPEATAPGARRPARALRPPRVRLYRASSWADCGSRTTASRKRDRRTKALGCQAGASRRTPGGPVTGSSDGKEATSFPASPPSRVGHRLCGRSGGYTWGREGRKSRPRLLLHQSNEVIFP